MSYIYQSQSDSPYKIFRASSALEGAFRAVELTADGVITCSAGKMPIGILSAETDEISAGDDVNVILRGETKWVTSEEIGAGDLLSCGADGLAKRATSDDIVFAQALSGALAGEVTNILIIRAGKV